MIIIEGPDGGGKSTLGEALSKEINWPYHHDGGPSTSAEHALERIRNLIDHDSDSVIRDRSTLFSDGVYKKAFSKTPFVSDAEIDGYVHLLVMKRDPVVIYVRPPADILIRNAEFLARAKPHKPPEYARQLRALIPELVEIYDRSMRRWSLLGLRVVRYDYTSTKLDEFVQDIRSGIKR